MNNFEKEILLDRIIKKFEGDVSYTWEKIHEKDFYESIHADYFVVENHINFLLGIGVLDESGTPRHINATLRVSRKGWLIMAEPGKIWLSC